MSRKLSGISQPGGNAVNRQKDSIGEASTFTLLLAGRLLSRFIKQQWATKRTQAAQQYHLKIAQRIDIGITASNRQLNHRCAIWQCRAAYNLQHHPTPPLAL